MSAQSAGHGPNIGHGYVKYVIIDQGGTELPPVVFPSLVARAGAAVAGALSRAAVTTIGGIPLWTGADALLAPSVLTMLAQDRLRDPLFLPALLRGALDRFGYLNGAGSGTCVSGLPASWAGEAETARLLGERLRAATSAYRTIKVIAEPLGLIYSALLDTHGQLAGDTALASGAVGVVDLGYLTIDTAIIQRLIPIPTSLDTYQLGTARPLQPIRSRLSAHFERELTLYEADQAVRVGALQIAGQERALPRHWDRPLIENGQAIAARLVETWGSGAQLDVILIGGGGRRSRRLRRRSGSAFHTRRWWRSRSWRLRGATRGWHGGWGRHDHTDAGAAGARERDPAWTAGPGRADQQRDAGAADCGGARGGV